MFDGTIHTQGIEYHIERAHKFFSTKQDFHSIVYRASDVDMPGTICGEKDKVYDALHLLQLTGVPTKKKGVTHDASQRMKRQIFSKMYCPVFVACDHLFLENVGGDDPALATLEMVNILSEVQTIFNSTEFIEGTSVQPSIARVEILDHKKTDYRFRAADIDVKSFLDLWSQENQSSFCLALLFTSRDFVNGVLGLAWVAEPTGGHSGGICEQSPIQLRDGSRYLNTAVVTSRNFGRQLPRSVSVVATAHQLGHNFGSLVSCVCH